MRAVLIPCLAAIALCAASSPAHAEAHDIALDMSGVRPAVSVSIDGRAAELWTFDTGAMGTIMNIEHARALGLPEQQPVRVGSPAGGTPLEGFLTTLSNVNVGGVTLPSLRVVAVPSPLPDRGGVLSPNAFSGRLVTFDFANSVVRIIDKAPPAIPAATPTAYRGAGPHSLPALEVTFGDQNWTAHMDTGAPGGLTFPYAMAETLPLAAAPVQTGVARFVDGEHSRYSATLNGRVQVGPLTLDNPQVEFIDGLPDLNVGMALLTQMAITLDPEERRTWAQAAATP